MQLETWSCSPLCARAQRLGWWALKSMSIPHARARCLPILPPESSELAGATSCTGSAFSIGEQRSMPPFAATPCHAKPSLTQADEVCPLFSSMVIFESCSTGILCRASAEADNHPADSGAQGGEAGEADLSTLRAYAVASKGARPVSVGVVPMTTSTCVGWRCRRRTRCGSGSPRELFVGEPTPQSVAVETCRCLACSGDLPWASPSSCC